MDEDINKLLVIVLCLIQKRKMGIRMSIGEKTRFISLLYEYFVYKIRNEYYIHNIYQGTEMVFLHNTKD